MVSREEIEHELCWGIEEPSWNRKPTSCTERWKSCIAKHTTSVEPIQRQDQNGDTSHVFGAQHFSCCRAVYAIVVPILVAQAIWWPAATTWNLSDLFSSSTLSYNYPRWTVAALMTTLSTLSAATGAAGSALLSPTMTMLLGTTPAIARDFYYLVQAVGMMCAACTVALLGLQVNFRAVVYCSLGGIVGVVFGLETITNLQKAYAEMYIACIWFAFALALLALNIHHNGKVFHEIPSWDNGTWLRCFNWRAAVLIFAGMVGGIVSSIAGPGVDLLATAVLVLLFRMSERVVTPTVVLLIAVNALTAALYREFVQGTVDTEVYRLLLVSVPVVAICAPSGVFLGAYLHRNFILCAFYITCTVQFLAAVCVVLPWTSDNTLTPADLTTKSAVLLFAALVFFVVLNLLGQNLLAFVDRSKLYDESTLPRDPKRSKAPKRTHTNSTAVDDEEIESDDPNEYHRLSLYPCREKLTPLDRDHSVVNIPLCIDDSKLDV